MSEAQQYAGIPPKEEPSSIKMVAVMGAVGLVASILLVATYQLTQPYILANQEAYLEGAIFDVLPGAEQRQGFVVTPDGELVSQAEEVPGQRVFAGYGEGGELVGVAIEASGQGFQDVLRILYGYDPTCECVVGMRVLESKETPGLGDKIETDPDFLASIDSLDVRLNPARSELLHQIGLVKQGGSMEAWDVAAITGATITTQAVATIINNSAEELLPILYENMDDLRQAAPARDDAQHASAADAARN